MNKAVCIATITSFAIVLSACGGGDSVTVSDIRLPRLESEIAAEEQEEALENLSNGGIEEDAAPDVKKQSDQIVSLAAESGEVSLLSFPDQITYEHITASVPETTGAPSSFSNSPYSVQYDLGSSLEAVSGMYSGSNVTGDAATYVIDQAGTMTGSNTDGCIFNGAVSLIDPTYNMYQVTYTVSNCNEFNGEYSGLGATLDWGTNDLDDTFSFSVTSSTYVISHRLQRI